MRIVTPFVNSNRLCFSFETQAQYELFTMRTLWLSVPELDLRGGRFKRWRDGHDDDHQIVIERQRDYEDTSKTIRNIIDWICENTTCQWYLTPEPESLNLHAMIKYRITLMDDKDLMKFKLRWLI